MVFLTNRYIYTPEKKEKKLVVEGIEFKSYLDDEFNMNVEENIRKEYENIIDYNNFYDYFKIFGNVAFYDEDVLIVNEKVISHNFLNVKRRKELFEDISEIEKFIKNHIDNSFVLITDEDLSLEHIKVKEALEKLKESLVDEIYIKVNGEFIKKKMPFSILCHHIDDIFIKINSEKLIKTSLNGAGFLKVKKEDFYIFLEVGDIKIKVEIGELV